MELDIIHKDTKKIPNLKLKYITRGINIIIVNKLGKILRKKSNWTSKILSTHLVIFFTNSQELEFEWKFIDKSNIWLKNDFIFISNSLSVILSEYIETNNLVVIVVIQTIIQKNKVLNIDSKVPHEVLLKLTSISIISLKKIGSTKISIANNKFAKTRKKILFFLPFNRVKAL